MTEQALPLIVVVTILIILIFISRNLDKNKIYRYKPAPNLLTQAELEFYHSLVKLLPQHAVMCKVRLADIIVPDERGSRWKYAFNKIRSKHIDFVVIDPNTSAIKLAIELDDSSHLMPKRVERDQFIKEIFQGSDLRIYRHKLGQPLLPESIGI